MIILLIVPLCLVICDCGLGQTFLEEITPLPGHDVSSVSPVVSGETGLWTTVSLDSSPAFDFNTYKPFYSGDGGDTWEMRDNGVPAGVGVFAVHVNPQNADLLWAETTVSCADNVGPWISTDRGLSWYAAAVNPAPEGQYFCRAEWFADGVHAWAQVTRPEWFSHLYLTADGGQTWDYIGNIDNNPWVQWFTHPTVPGVVNRNWGAPYRSTDYGYHWTACDRNGLGSLRYGGTGPDAALVYAVGDYRPATDPNRYSAFYVLSTDTGYSWHFLNPSDTLGPVDGFRAERTILPDRTQWGHLFASSVDSLFESTDNGQSWRTLSGGGQYSFQHLGYDSERQRLYAAGSFPDLNIPGVQGLWRMDVGMSVGPRRVPDPPTVLDVTIYPNPASDRILLSVPPAFGTSRPLNVKLFNILGQLAWSRTLDALPLNRSPYVVALPSGLSDGTYFLSVQGSVGPQIKQLVVKR